jgi:hypothetical protein
MTAPLRPVRTLAQARAFVRREGLVGIFSDAGGTMPSLWAVVDLPDRRPGERGWGEKISAIWRWKNELPARWPDEIFYGKLPGGLAVLMTLGRLADHYRAYHVPLERCSALARRAARIIAHDPLTSRQVRQELGLDDRAGKAAVDRALTELQVTLNIARRTSLTDRNDTLVPFREQYLAVVPDP